MGGHGFALKWLCLAFAPQPLLMHRRLTGLMAAGALLVVGPAAAMPAAAMEVILLRHADKDGRRGDYNLSPVGFQRSIALATLIPACFGMPTRITSFYLDPVSSKNARSYQSAVPLAVATGVNIRIDETSLMNSFAQGQRLRQSLHADGERVVLFWEHRRLPDLARGLGWGAMPEIANDDFDQLILFRFTPPIPASSPSQP